MDQFQIESTRPFLLSRSAKPTLLPQNYANFDESVESNIRFVQGINSFVFVESLQSGLLNNRVCEANVFPSSLFKCMQRLRGNATSCNGGQSSLGRSFVDG